MSQSSSTYSSLDPWIIQVALPTRDMTTGAFNTEKIPNRSKIGLLNAKSGEYLTADPRYRGIIDRHLHLEEMSEGTFLRFHLG
jgi:hypothetical protein